MTAVERGGADAARMSAIAQRVRAEVVRMTARVEGGHPGGSLSVADLLVALYFAELRIRPKEPDWPERDRLVLSKGHAVEALYATMALRGYLPIAELETFGRLDSRLQGHPDMTKLPGVDISTGSLGCGFSAAVGMALGLRHAGGPQRVYAVVGDGECQEGIVWEAAWFAARSELSNLVAIVDFNSLQQSRWPLSQVGPREAPWQLDELVARWQATGWSVVEIDGHDLTAVRAALADARSASGQGPRAIIARTVKGKGVSFMEDDASWHSGSPTPDEVTRALEEIDAAS